MGNQGEKERKYGQAGAQEEVAHGEDGLKREAGREGGGEEGRGREGGGEEGRGGEGHAS
jgi:hypothetical protein